jgi:enoyl-CoA hydratase/carnithine racemase
MRQQETVLIDVADGFVRIRMNWPERLNALDGLADVGLNEALLRVDLDSLALTDEGHAFVASGEVSGFYTDPENGSPPARKVIALPRQALQVADQHWRAWHRRGRRHELWPRLHDARDQSWTAARLATRPTAGSASRV